MSVRVNVDLDQNIVSYGEKSVRLTPKQAEIAYVIAKSKNPIKLNDLFDKVQGLYSDNSVINFRDHHMHKLRDKLSAIGLGIQRGDKGYRICDNVSRYNVEWSEDEKALLVECRNKYNSYDDYAHLFPNRSRAALWRMVCTLNKEGRLSHASKKDYQMLVDRVRTLTKTHTMVQTAEILGVTRHVVSGICKRYKIKTRGRRSNLQPVSDECRTLFRKPRHRRAD